MKKLVLTVLGLALSIGIVFASGSAEGSGKPELDDADLVTSNRIGNPNAENTITFAARQSLSHQGQRESRTEHLVAAHTEWAKAHPNYKIEVTMTPGSVREAMTRMIEQANAGRAPEIAQIDSFFAAQFYDYLHPLGDYLSEEQLNDWVEFAREGMIDDDGQVKLWWITTGAYGLYYRTDLFPEPPRTWDELIQYGKEAQEQGYVGFIYPAGRAEAAVMGPILPNFWALGGDLVDSEGRPVFNEGQNREAMLRVFGFLQRTVEEGITPTWISTKGKWSDLYPDFATGDKAMFLGGGWFPSRLPELLGSQEEADKYSFAAIPTPSSDIPIMTANGGWTMGVFNSDSTGTDIDSEKMNAIVDFVESAYVSPEGMAGVVVGSGLAPRKSVAEIDDPYFQTDHYQTMVELTRIGGRARPGVFIYPTISSELQVAISDVIAGRKNPEAALDRAWENVMQTYESQTN